jgi:archaemetzincin
MRYLDKHIFIIATTHVVFLLGAVFFLTRSQAVINSANLINGKTLKYSRTVIVQPFHDLPSSQVSYTLKKLKAIFYEVKLLPPVQLPAHAYYQPRDRYRALKLLEWLSDQTPAKAITIGITSKDISVTKEGVSDYGVMGYAYKPGNACMASSFRLKSSKEQSLFKVVIHELAHAEGLPHCPKKTCYLRDAEGKNRTAELTGFCSDCTKYLSQKGWKL